jgi:hypothetical protein
MGRVHAFNGMAKPIKRLKPSHAEHEHGKHPPLPGRVEKGLLFFPNNGPETGHPPHIVHTVHAFSPLRENGGEITTGLV